LTSRCCARTASSHLVTPRRDGQTIWCSIASAPARELLTTLYRVIAGKRRHARRCPRNGRPHPSTAFNVANNLAALTVCECGGPQSIRHEGYLLSGLLLAPVVEGGARLSRLRRCDRNRRRVNSAADTGA
jgi:hypothetical protein